MSAPTAPSSGAPSSDHSFAAFRTFFAMQRPHVIDTITQCLREQIAADRALQPAQLAARVDMALDAYLAGLNDHSSFETWIEGRFGALGTLALDLQEALARTTCFRHGLLDVCLKALEAGIGDATAALHALLELNDTALSITGRIFQNRLWLFESLAEQGVDTIVVSDLDGKSVYMNPAAGRNYGASRDTLLTLELSDFIPPEDIERISSEIQPQLLREGYWQGEMGALRADGSAYRVQNTSILLKDVAGKPIGTASFTRDITADIAATQERALLQEQVITAQQAALRELSTPLIPLANDIVAMPLIGSIDSRRAQAVIETLLEGVATQHAAVAILDITGVAVVDTQVANALLRAAQAVRLLGTEVVLTGIRPEVAQTLVGLGVDLQGIITHSTLQAGIAYATRRRTRGADKTASGESATASIRRRGM